MNQKILLWRQRVRRYGLSLIAFLLLSTTIVAVIGFSPRNIIHAATGDWTTYLGGDARTGYNGQETIITPATAASLKLLWTARTIGAVSSEVAVVNNVGYYGSWDGALHAANLATGQDYWSTPLGTKPGSCTALNYGLVGTPAIATIGSTQMAFVAGGQDNVTAVNTSNGSIVWQTNIGNNSKGQFIYDSTAVYNGSVYIGLDDFGDCPLEQGQVYQLNAATGQIEHTFNVVPNGCIGAGVWSSPTIDDATGMVYITTGNADPQNCVGNEPYASAIVELRASDLSFVSAWQATANGALDFDIGATPTLFTATIGGVTHQMIGVVSKDGNYYALDRTNLSAGPLWKATISVGGTSPEYGLGSISSSAFDGTRLYVAGGNTTINGTTCQGSLRALDPNTGNFIWQVCRNSPALGGVIAVPGLVVSGAGNTFIVVNSTTGATLYSYTDTQSNAKFWGSATISNGVLYYGSRSGSLFAFATNGQVPSPTPTGSPVPTLPPGPVSKTWYFAEGHIGASFQQYLTIQNPDPTNACAVSIQYLLSSGAQTPKVVTVGPNTRWTENVDQDLNVSRTGSFAEDVSTIVTVNSATTPNCKGVVAERPMYFTNLFGASSGHDALGATHLGTSFYFPDVASFTGFRDFITIINPP